MLEAGEEAVELAALKVKLGQLLHHVELVVQLFGAVERPPVHLDRFVGLILARQGFGQSQHHAAFVGIGAHRPAQGVEAFLGLPQPEAELGEELIVFGIAGRSRQQVSAGFQSRLDPPEAGFEPGNAGQVLDAIAAVDLGEPRERSAASPRLPDDSRTRARSVQAGSTGDRSRSPFRPHAPPPSACCRPRSNGPAYTSPRRGLPAVFQFFLHRRDR